MQFAGQCTESKMMRAAEGRNALLASSMTLYREFVQRENVECEWTDEGLLLVFRSKKEFVGYRKTADLLQREFGIPTDCYEGEAVKEIFFTRKGETLYAITPTLPVGEFVVRGVTLEKNGEISLLGYRETLAWRQSGGDVIIELPEIRQSQLPSDLAFVFRMTNVSR